MKLIIARQPWFRLFAGGILTVAIAALATAPAFADLPGEHPEYLHSRSDLRRAEAMLRYTDAPEVMHKLERAANNVHDAIGNLDRAIYLDRKPEMANPPSDVPHLERTGRFREIERILNTSLKDLERPEDNPEAREPRRLASEHIRIALADVQEASRIYHDDHAIEAVPPPPPLVEHHPHYLHALIDLRYARALLDRHGEGEWRRERERMAAIEEIDRALAEVKRAAIDDGRDLNEHPAIDWGVPHRERLVKTVEALDSALKNLDFEEDDLAAHGWRDAARQHVREARRLVDITMRD